MCNNGKRQSPINIDPKNILYDPGLSEIAVDDIRVSKFYTATWKLNNKLKKYLDNVLLQTH